jgi:predicted TIM-barrel fold metal-dependent hydrolase
MTLDWLISVDDHIVEGPDVWTRRLPKKYQDVCPRVVTNDKGEDVWAYEDVRWGVAGVSAVIGREKDDWSLAPVRYEDVHPSCFDPAARIEIMDQAGILAQANFPTFPRFCGQAFAEAKDKDLALLCVQAWNDHILEDWCGAFPGRFLPLAMIPMWDARLAAQEGRRAIEKGARGIMFSENAASLGLPSIHDKDGYWEPLFELADETGLPICMHSGSSSKIPTTAADAPSIIQVGSGLVINAIQTLWDWTFSGLFFQYENMKIVLSEGQVGWMPYMLDWMNHTLDRQRWAKEGDFATNYAAGEYTARARSRKIVDPEIPPSVIFRDHIYGCILDDPVGIRNIDLIGVDNVLLETDFPHSDGSWPHSLELAHKQLAPLGEDGMYKVMQGNARRVFQFTPAEPPVLATAS